MRDYEIPESDWQGLAAILINRLADALLSFAADQDTYPALRVFDSAREVALDPATERSTDISGDWANEIHPSREGYRKIASAWCQAIDNVLYGEH